MSVSYRRVFSQQVAKDLRQHGRHLGLAITPLLFFCVVVALFPLSMTPDARWLARIAPGVVWVAALLATLLSLQTLFSRDFDDGSLQIMAMSEVPLWFQAMAKQTAHWLVCGLPLVLLGPVAAYSLHLSADSYVVLVVALIFGTMTLSAFGAIGAALTVSIGQGGLLFAVLVLPLIVPVLILGTQATELASTTGSTAGAVAAVAEVGGVLWILMALCVLAITLAPFATAAALRVSLD